MGVNGGSGASEGSSEDMVRLKDHMGEGGVGRGEDIVKTTDIRISVDDLEREAGSAQGVARAW